MFLLSIIEQFKDTNTHLSKRELFNTEEEAYDAMEDYEPLFPDSEVSWNISEVVPLKDVLQ